MAQVQLRDVAAGFVFASVVTWSGKRMNPYVNYSFSEFQGVLS